MHRKHKQTNAFCQLYPRGQPPCIECEPSTAPSQVKGTVILEAGKKSRVRVRYEIEGLTPGLHGFHIHELSDFSDGCLSAGPHFNPHGSNHGGLSSPNRHIGDFGNIAANESGVAVGIIETDSIQINGPWSIEGRSFVVHADPDDLGVGGNPLSITTGNSGSRVSCGEIRLLPPESGFHNGFIFLILLTAFYVVCIPAYCLFERGKLRNSRLSLDKASSVEQVPVATLV